MGFLLGHKQLCSAANKTNIGPENYITSSFLHDKIMHYYIPTIYIDFQNLTNS